MPPWRHALWALNEFHSGPAKLGAGPDLLSDPPARPRASPPTSRPPRDLHTNEARGTIPHAARASGRFASTRGVSARNASRTRIGGRSARRRAIVLIDRFDVTTMPNR